MLDGESETRVAVDTTFYKHLDHGYAATVHKAQGSTADRTYVLAMAHFDRHTTYVTLFRHLEAATAFYARDDFGGGFDPEAAKHGWSSDCRGRRRRTSRTTISSARGRRR